MRAAVEVHHDFSGVRRQYSTRKAHEPVTHVVPKFVRMIVL